MFLSKVVREVSKNRITCIFRVKQSKENGRAEDGVHYTGMGAEGNARTVWKVS